MREILFRGKRIDNGEWAEGWLIADDVIVPCGQVFFIEGTHLTEHNLIMYDVIPETVGQYTGLTDKNGKKIYEGDIVEYRYKFKDGSEKPFRAEVKAGEISFGSYHKVYGFCAYLEFGEVESSEVIGNIHDNPELLEEVE